MKKNINENYKTEFQQKKIKNLHCKSYHQIGKFIEFSQCVTI